MVYVCAYLCMFIVSVTWSFKLHVNHFIFYFILKEMVYGRVTTNFCLSCTMLSELSIYVLWSTSKHSMYEIDGFFFPLNSECVPWFDWNAFTGFPLMSLYHLTFFLVCALLSECLFRFFLILFFCLFQWIISIFIVFFVVVLFAHSLHNTYVLLWFISYYLAAFCRWCYFGVSAVLCAKNWMLHCGFSLDENKKCEIKCIKWVAINDY